MARIAPFIFGLLFWTSASTARAQPATASPLDQLAALVPARVADCTAERAAQVAAAAERMEAWAADQARLTGLQASGQFIERVDRLHRTKTQVDKLLSGLLALRGSFVALPADDAQRALLRGYLQTAATLIDLAGRLRYTLVDATNAAADQLPAQSADYDRLTATLLAHRSSVGAMTLADDLFIPPATNFRRAQAASYTTKSQLIALLSAAGNPDVIDRLARFAADPQSPPALAVAAVAGIKRLGLPQDPRPGQDPTLPKPATTARALQQVLSRIAPERLDSSAQARRRELLAWLEPRIERGLGDEPYRLGTFDVQPGDWLLMRNPSPYNRFTDLSPGLFTHVGLITTEEGSDGIRRMVLVDLPEIGRMMQTTNVDTFVQRTLHYLVLRHNDPAVCQAMANVARQLIGNPTQFDLNFRTDRIAELKGQPLAGKLIHTYCAGLLLLCAQETGRPRSEFFPFVEAAAGGKTVENLAKLGLSFGDGFVSPTGALFSPQLKIVGRRDAMYSPRREAEEAIYDYFAAQLVARTLSPSPDLYQSLRQKLAEAGKANPLLAKMLAQSLDVSEGLDLVSAAKAAAVVETLDEIARNAGIGFENSRAALTGADARPDRTPLTASDRAAIAAYRQRHADLLQAWEAGSLSPRALRIALVRYYVEKQKRQLDARFFHEAVAP